jgi:Conjugal transfer protein TrbL
MARVVRLACFESNAMSRLSTFLDTPPRARALTPTVLGALVVLALAVPPVTLARPAVEDDGCVFGPLCAAGDAGAWLQQTIQMVVAGFLSGLVTDLGNALVVFVNDINFLTRTPEELSYADQLVSQFASATQVVANSLLAVVVLVNGYNIMLRPYLGATHTSSLEFLPRLLLGGILINTAGWWCRLAIDANNAVCEVFGAPTVADVIATALRVVGAPIAGVLMVLIVVVMAVLLVVQQLMRLALIDLLLILAPIAALLWILPQTQAWGRLWGRLFVATVFAQAVQVLTLRLGFNLATGLPPLSAAGLLQPLLGIAVLALALKVPSLMGGGSAGGNVATGLLGTAARAAVAVGTGLGVRALAGAGIRAAARRP